MRKSKLDNPVVKAQVVKDLALRKSQNSIAREVGLSQSQVCRFANREDIQRLIEEETKNLLEVLPDAVENVKTLVRNMSKLPRKDTKNRELSYKASTRVMESAGLLNTTTPSYTVVSMVNQESLMPPLAHKLLDEYLKGLTDNEVSDPVDPEAETPEAETKE